MRQLPSTEPKFTAPDATSAAAAPETVLAQSALHMARAAIARWSGSSRPAGAPARDLLRISPQARWLAQAQYGLATWIAHGGFSQPDEPALAPLTTPLMHNCGALPQMSTRAIGACID